MSNLFDDLRDICHDTAAITFGKQASWSPSAGGETQTNHILFNDPDSIRKLGEIEYDPANTVIEWRKPFFDGLKTTVDAGTTNENMVIEGDTYYVRTVKNIHDGNTQVAVIAKI